MGSEVDTKRIVYPYIPEGRTIEYVAADNFFINLAKKFARLASLDEVHPTGTVIARGPTVMGFGANGSGYHKHNECERKKRKIPTGQGYELCEGCHPKNHSEQRALEDAVRKGGITDGSDLYLWGHWWCCNWCWDAINKAKIGRVYLLEGSEVMFNNKHPDNIIGRQFKDSA